MSFEFNPSMPDITSKDASRVYSIGKYHALLVSSPPMLAAKHMQNIDKDLLITYLFAMAISEGSDIKMIITSEITSQKIMSVANDEIKKELIRPSLCIFNNDGSHENLGKFADWSNIELFCNKCLELVGERLGETNRPILLNSQLSMHKTNTLSNNIKNWHFGKILILITIYLLLLLVALIAGDELYFFNSSQGALFTVLCVFTPPLATIIWIWLTGREK